MCANVAEELVRKVVSVQVELNVGDVREQKLDRHDEVLARNALTKKALGLLARVQLHEFSMKNSQLTTICMAASTTQCKA